MQSGQLNVSPKHFSTKQNEFETDLKSFMLETKIFTTSIVYQPTPKSEVD